MQLFHQVQQILERALELEGLYNGLSMGSEEGSLIRKGDKKREKKDFSWKHAIKDKTLPCILYSSANWKWETYEPKVLISTSIACSLLSSDRQNAMAHTVNGEQKGRTIKRKNAKYSSWNVMHVSSTKCHLGSSSYFLHLSFPFSFVFYFCAFLIFPSMHVGRQL